MALAGVYRAGRAHDIAIAPFRTPAGWMLLLADRQTDQLRLLAPAGNGKYEAGAEFTRTTPAEWTLTFTPAAKPTKLIVEETGTKLRFTAKPIPIAITPVSFRNGATRLEGSLYRPSRRTAKLPLVALAHGSEENDRYSFGPIPWVLASQGYAVLVYDKRGTGSSTGDWRSAGLEDYADDLIAGIRAMLQRSDIDRSRTAVVGVSEGAWVAPLAASRWPSIRAIAAISGGARTKGDAYVFKARREAEADGMSPAAVDSVVRDAEQLVATSVRNVTQGSASGFDRRVAYDPTQDWRRFRGPVLYMGGEADVLESGREAAAWFRRLFAESDNVDATIRLWPRAHHSLLQGVTGDPAEFHSLRGITQLAPGYWDVLLRWLELQRFPNATP
jgi:dipeptidyl aminopeptidase/acylaminoacyl peptidase